MSSHTDLLVQHHGNRAIDLMQQAIEELLKSQDCTLRSQIVEIEEVRKFIWENVWNTYPA